MHLTFPSHWCRVATRVDGCLPLRKKRIAPPRVVTIRSLLAMDVWLDVLMRKLIGTKCFFMRLGLERDEFLLRLPWKTFSKP